MTRPSIVGVCQFSDGILRSVYVDAEGQFFFDDERRKVRGSSVVGTGATGRPKQIGICLFTDGSHRIVYRDQSSEFVFDDEGNRVYGKWINSDDQLFEDDEADMPVITKSGP
jgi:hypothetical protein